MPKRPKMKIFKQIAPLKTHLKQLRLSGKSIGLVPTMGALHKGHLALIEASKSQNEITVSTIFVNPTQFNNPSDLSAYPRTPKEDTELLEEVQCDVLFAPDTSEIYPAPSSITLDFGELDKVMEGKFRPGHFSGVGVIVASLFNIIRPDHAYFGQKDWQQFAIIRQLAQQLHFGVELHSVPTLREPDGLALSSRNLRLTPDQRQYANIFFQALMMARKELLGRASISSVKQSVSELIAAQAGVELEYFEVADRVNLKPLENVEAASCAILCIAGYVGPVRLIDNVFLD